MAADTGRRVLVAQLGAPHGVRGAVRLRAFTEEADVLLRCGPFETRDGRTLAIRRLRQDGKVPVAEIEGVEDRDAAEALKGLELYIPRHRLPAPAEEEWYHVDLIGLAAVDGDGGEIGTVVAVQDFGAGDLLEVRLVGRKRTVLIPFTRAAVPEVNLAAGRIVVDPPRGLLDEGGKDAP